MRGAGTVIVRGTLRMATQTNRKIVAAVVREDAAHKQRLLDRGVHTSIHYPIAPHHQQAYAQSLGHLKLPLTEALHREVVSLPVSPVMTDEQVAYVIAVINQA